MLRLIGKITIEDTIPSTLEDLLVSIIDGNVQIYSNYVCAGAYRCDTEGWREINRKIG